MSARLIEPTEYSGTLVNDLIHLASRRVSRVLKAWPQKPSDTMARAVYRYMKAVARLDKSKKK